MRLFKLMNLRFFLHVAKPALLLGAVLFCACVAAIWSVNRLQAGMSQILSQDVASLRAAHDIESSLRQLRYHSFLFMIEPVPARARVVEEDQRGFEEALRRVRRTAHDGKEIELLDRLEVGYERYRSELNQAGHATPALRGSAIAHWDDVHPIRHVLAPCHELMRSTCEAMEETAADSNRVSRRTQGGLLLLGALGPLSGLAIGFGVARGLSRSIAQLQVRLQDVHDDLDQEVGSVKLTTHGNIDLLHDQVERIVARVREVLQELDRQQQEILRAEQLAAVGQLAASIAHEVRNPLTGIKMIIEVARRGQSTQAPTAEDLEVIHSEVERIERKVQGLLDFARPKVARRQPVDLRDSIEQGLRLIDTRLRQQGIRADVHVPDRPVEVEADPDHLASVLVNLFLNALDAMPRGGALMVDLKAPPGGSISLSVADTGPGVAPSIKGRLFTPFASTKPTGTGLGLSTSRRVVEEHGGRLLASNLPQGGACFTIVLPA